MFRYILSGGTAAFVNLAGLYILVRFFGFHYLLSATIAFIIAFIVSFLLQKYWTFGNFERQRGVVQKQLSTFFLIALINLGLNTTLMYFFVGMCGFWYMFAQFLSSGLIALSSFFLYKIFVFKKQPADYIPPISIL